MSLIVFKQGDGIGSATPTAVTPGSTVSINWQDKAFVVHVAPDTGDMIKLSCDPAIPPGSCAGLIVGPAFKGNAAAIVVGSDNVTVQKDGELIPPDD